MVATLMCFADTGVAWHADMICGGTGVCVTVWIGIGTPHLLGSSGRRSVGTIHAHQQ
jgi:hypothetical protein